MTSITETHKYQALHDAVSAIAGMCDGAVTQDGVGFNGHDTKFGKRVAETPVTEWQFDMACEVYKMLELYKGQLSTHGIDYDSLQSPGDDFDSRLGRDQARQAEYARKNAPYAEFIGDVISVLKSYPIKDDLKANGFKFNYGSKAWDAPLNAQTANTLIRLNVSLGRLTESQRAFIITLNSSYVPEIVTAEVNEPANIRVCSNHPSSLKKEMSPDHLTLQCKFGTIPLAITRALPGRQWDGLNKCDHIEPNIKLYVLAEEYGLTISDDAREMIESKREEQEIAEAVKTALVEESFATETNMTVALNDYLRGYQRAGAAYMIRHKNSINADEMGLGKTAQSLSTIETRNAYPCVIVCPASLAANWAREIKNLLPHRHVVVQSGRAGDWELPPVDFRIMSYNVVESYIDYLYPIAGLICDEAHNIKNEKAKRTKAIQRICGNGVTEITVNGRKTSQPLPGLVTNDPTIAMLTGTPILNRPKELIPLLVAMGYLARSQDDSGRQTVGWFLYRFCAKRDRTTGKLIQGYMGKPDFNGAENLEELHIWLRQTCMVGRVKDDVLTELPAKMRAPQFMMLDAKALATYERLADEGAEKAAKSRAEALVYMNALRHAIGSAKADMAIEWANDFIESSGKKLIIFAHHKDVQTRIINGLTEAGHKVVSILGAQSPKKTEAAKAEFQTGDAQIIVCSLIAAGVGHTLTAASDVLIVEQGWNSGTQDQAEDRAHRIGQTESVTIWYLIAQDTFDDDMYEIVESKRQVTNMVNRGVTDADSADSAFTAVLDRTLAKHGARRTFKVAPKEEIAATELQEMVVECNTCHEINLCTSRNNEWYCSECE